MKQITVFSFYNFRLIMYRGFLLAAVVSFPFISHSQKEKHSLDIYTKSNLVAWCIVPFDNKDRTPEERGRYVE